MLIRDSKSCHLQQHLCPVTVVQNIANQLRRLLFHKHGPDSDDSDGRIWHVRQMTEIDTISNKISQYDTIQKRSAVGPIQRALPTSRQKPYLAMPALLRRTQRHVHATSQALQYTHTVANSACSGGRSPAVSDTARISQKHAPTSLRAMRLWRQ